MFSLIAAVFSEIPSRDARYYAHAQAFQRLGIPKWRSVSESGKSPCPQRKLYIRQNIGLPRNGIRQFPLEWSDVRLCYLSESKSAELAQQNRVGSDLTAGIEPPPTRIRV